VNAAPEPTAAAPGPTSIEARLSAFDVAMVVFSLVVGIGIFRTPASVARAAGDAPVFYAAWIAAGIISLIGALTFAEIGSRQPRAGGYYRVVADCYGATPAFMLNWAQTLLQGAGAAAVAFIGADFLVPVVLPPQQQTSTATFSVAFGTMIVLLALNYCGIKPGARAQNLLSGMKILMIVGLALTALALAPHAAAVSTAAPAPPVALRLASALIPCFYCYGGYQLTMNLGADLKNAQRRFPIAIAGGMLTVIALYLLLNAAYQHTLGIDGIARSDLAAAALARALFGPTGEMLISIAVFLSAAGFVNATILQMPRIYYAMAEDGVLPRAFLRVNRRTQVQEAGLGFFAVTMLVPAFMLTSFDRLVVYIIFIDTLTIAAVASTLFVLRRRRTGEGGYSMRGFPLLPALYIAGLLAVAARAFSVSPGSGLAGIAILLMGWPLFRVGRKVFAVRPAPNSRVS
jgi:basic amino acid/polyamine antiporter, APA family